MGRDKEQPVGLYPCAENKTNPQDTQFYVLRYYRDIALKRSANCLDSHQGGNKADLVQFPCHHSQGNQYFRYDPKTSQIFHGSKKNNRCVDMDILNRSVFVTACDSSSKTQQWRWGFVNETNINNWLSYGSKIEDASEIHELKKLSYLKK